MSRYFLQKAHSTEQTPVMRVFLSGIYFAAKSTEAMRTKCLAQGHNIMMQQGFESSISVSRNRHLIHMSCMLQEALQKPAQCLSFSSLMWFKSHHLCRSGLATQHHHWRKNECSAILSRYSWVSDSTGSSPLESMSGRTNLLRAMGGTTCGWHLSDHRQVYIAGVHSMLEYAGASRAHWLSATTSKLERVQLDATRAITGLVHSTPVEAVVAESKLSPISKRFQTIILLTSVPIIHQRSIVVKPSSPHADSAWRGKTGTTLNFSILINSISIPRLYFWTPLLWAAFQPPIEQVSLIPTIITPVDKKMSPSQ